MQSNSSFTRKIDQLRQLRLKNLEKNRVKPLVVISGAGPAGLLRGIQALCSGIPTIILEKRSASHACRRNPLFINAKSVDILKKYAIYDCLLEQKMIVSFKAPAFFAAIGDLEKAMKIVLQEVCGAELIHYDSQIEEIVRHAEKDIDLIINTSGRPLWTIQSVNLLVIAEGTHSTTNKNLLQNAQREILPPVKYLIASSQRSQNVEQMNKGLRIVFHHLYYHFVFLGFLFTRLLRFWNPSFPVAKTAIINTPGQKGIVVVFTKNTTDKMLKMTTGNKDSRKTIESFLKRWIAISQWHANYSKLISIILRRNYIGHFGLLRSIDYMSIIELVTCYSNTSSGEVGNTPYIIVGDALCTVDPFTGLGCNSAIQTSSIFQVFIEGLEENKNKKTLLNKYDLSIGEEIEELHTASVYMRESYRPDTLFFGQAALRRAREKCLQKLAICCEHAFKWNLD